MSKFYFFGIILLATGLVSGEGIKAKRWNPREHPAFIDRKITAFTSPARHLAIRAEFGGLVETILFESGDRIEGPKNSMTAIVILDNIFAKIQKDRAQTNVDLAHLKVKQQEAQMNLVKRAFDFQMNEVKRIESLASSGKIRQSELDRAKFNADSESIRIQIEGSALEIAKEEITMALVELKDAEERLSRYVINAPTGWILQERFIEPGAYIQPGEVILQLADTSELAINVRLSEQEIVSLENQKSIEIAFVQHPSFKANARIHHIDVDHDPVTNKRLVELRISGNSAPSFSGGLEVSFRVSIPDPSGLVLVPREFVTLRLEQNFVTLEDNVELAIVPLRQKDNWILISEEFLPENAVLTRP